LRQSQCRLNVLFGLLGQLVAHCVELAAENGAAFLHRGIELVGSVSEEPHPSSTSFDVAASIERRLSEARSSPTAR
jgi:hypothetical protein